MFGFIQRFIGRLRFPQLFLLTAGLFVLDFCIPDPIPFFDEILLALVTAMLAVIRRPEPPPAGGPRVEKNVTPR
jgi:hypothetical protein